jgi:hypothetical protein
MGFAERSDANEMIAAARQTRKAFRDYRDAQSAFDWFTVAKRRTCSLQRRRIPNTGVTTSV